MNFGSYLAQGFRMLLFKQQAVAAIRDDPNATRNGLIALAILSAFGGLGMAFFTWALSFIPEVAMQDAPAFPPMTVGTFIGVFLVWALIAVVSTAAVWGLVHLLAKLLKGDARFGTFIGTIMAASIAIAAVQIPITPLTAIPFLGALIAIVFYAYGLSLQVFVIRETYGFETWRAIVAWLVPVATLILLVVGAFVWLATLPPI